MIFLFLLTCVSDQFFAPGSSGPRMIILQLLTFQCIFFTGKSCKCVLMCIPGSRLKHLGSSGPQNMENVIFFGLLNRVNKLGPIPLVSMPSCNFNSSKYILSRCEMQDVDFLHLAIKIKVAAKNIILLTTSFTENILRHSFVY